MLVFEELSSAHVNAVAYHAGMTDEECVELLLLGLKCGATLCDVMGDLYHPEKYELTLAF